MWEVIFPDEATTTLKTVFGGDIVQSMAVTKYILQSPLMHGHTYLPGFEDSVWFD